MKTTQTAAKAYSAGFDSGRDFAHENGAWLLTMIVIVFLCGRAWGRRGVSR